MWDYFYGIVVCSNCGVVVERVYYDGPPRVNENEEIWRMIRTRGNPRVNPVVHSLRQHYKLYRKAQTYVEGRPWLMVDYDKFFETGRMVHTITSKATVEAVRNIEENGLWEVVEQGLKIIEEKNPALLARSGRGKYALAYMVAEYVSNKRFPPVEKVVEIFNISETSYRRLVKLVKELMVVDKPVVL